MLTTELRDLIDIPPTALWPLVLPYEAVVGAAGVVTPPVSLNTHPDYEAVIKGVYGYVQAPIPIAIPAPGTGYPIVAGVNDFDPRNTVRVKFNARETSIKKELFDASLSLSAVVGHRGEPQPMQFPLHVRLQPRSTWEVTFTVSAGWTNDGAAPPVFTADMVVGVVFLGWYQKIGL